MMTRPIEISISLLSYLIKNSEYFYDTGHFLEKIVYKKPDIKRQPRNNYCDNTHELSIYDIEDLLSGKPVKINEEIELIIDTPSSKELGIEYMRDSKPIDNKTSEAYKEDIGILHVNKIEALSKLILNLFETLEMKDSKKRELFVKALSSIFLEEFYNSKAEDLKDTITSKSSSPCTYCDANQCLDCFNFSKFYGKPATIRS